METLFNDAPNGTDPQLWPTEDICLPLGLRNSRRRLVSPYGDGALGRYIEDTAGFVTLSFIAGIAAVAATPQLKGFTGLNVPTMPEHFTGKLGTRVYLADCLYQPLKTLAKAGFDPDKRTCTPHPMLSDALDTASLLRT